MVDAKEMGNAKEPMNHYVSLHYTREKNDHLNLESLKKFSYVSYIYAGASRLNENFLALEGVKIGDYPICMEYEIVIWHLILESGENFKLRQSIVTI